MPETPRTWTMRQTDEPGIEWLVEGPWPRPGEVVETIKKAPVDAERERLLDLVIDLYEGYCGRLRVSVQNELHQRVETVLREYGRLGKEES